ncbi:MAG: hypothetical protein J5702_06245 [Bacteroidales bacterium]|nr:hypothetical protein [Bacteroidales bacterium]
MNRIFTRGCVVALASAMLFVSTGCNDKDLDELKARVETLETVTIESLKGQIQQMSTSLGEYKSTQDQLSGYVTNLQGRVSTLEGQDYDGLKSLVDDLKDRADAFDESLTNLQSYVDQKGGDLMQWVKDYYTTLELFNGLKSTVTGIETSITTIISRLNGLDETTAGIAQDLEEATGQLTTDLAACREDIDNIIDAIEDLGTALATLYEEVQELISAVQSVVVVPDYSDGSVKITDGKVNVIRFEVYPLEAAQHLADIGASAFSLDFVETATKASSLINIPVSGVSFDEEFLSIVADGSDLPEEIKNGDKSANARLRISDGIVTRSSEYFLLSYTAAPPDESDAVDLGLSVKWAKSNLSEDGLCANPEDYGDYYAWGELEPHYARGHSHDWPCSDWRTIDGKTMTGYNWASYKWVDFSTNRISRYYYDDPGGPEDPIGSGDNKTTFRDYDFEDDAARVILGGKWRIPTYEEWTELCTQCEWTKTTQNGIEGRLVTAQNGNSIFLPSSGMWEGVYNNGLNSAGRYGSSTLSPGNAEAAWLARWTDPNEEDVSTYTLMRYYGYTLRPVWGE